jgi:hypothetical protein
MGFLTEDEINVLIPAEMLPGRPPLRCADCVGPGR